MWVVCFKLKQYLGFREQFNFEIIIFTYMRRKILNLNLQNKCTYVCIVYLVLYLCCLCFKSFLLVGNTYLNHYLFTLYIHTDLINLMLYQV